MLHNCNCFGVATKQLELEKITTVGLGKAIMSISEDDTLLEE